MILALMLLQAAAPPPDIEFHATVRARSLTIEKRGNASLTVTTDPPGKPLIDIRAPKANGRKHIRNPVITVDFEARIADPRRQPETPAPQ